MLYSVDIISQSLFFSEELFKLIFEQGNCHCGTRYHKIIEIVIRPEGDFFGKL